MLNKPTKYKKFLFSFFIVLTLLSGSSQAGTQFSSGELLNAIKNKNQEVIISMLKNASEKPDYVDSLSMFVIANVFLQLKDLETATFLFYAAQIRAAADLKFYKPIGKGGNSPSVALGAVKHQLGTVINPNIVKYPKAYANVVNRLDEWLPVYKSNYDPGWQSKSQPDFDSLKTAIIEIKSKRIKTMREISTLLNNKDYFDAFLIVQKQNFLLSGDRDKEAKESAEKIMRNIEEELGLNGFIALGKK